MHVPPRLAAVLVAAVLLGGPGCALVRPDVRSRPEPVFPERPLDDLLARPDLQALVDAQVRRDGPALVAALASPDAAVRARAAFALGSVQDPDAVDALLDALRDDAPAGLRLVVEDASDGAEVVAVAGSLRRVFANLVSNAFAALKDRAVAEPAGSSWAPVLTVALRTLPADAAADATADAPGSGPAVEVSVADNGPGLAPDVRARVFEPFFTTRPAGQGTGLGLSLAYDIVTQGHSGTLETRDTPGDGATFVVTLPMG